MIILVLLLTGLFGHGFGTHRLPPEYFNSNALLLDDHGTPFYRIPGFSPRFRICNDLISTYIDTVLYYDSIRFEFSNKRNIELQSEYFLTFKVVDQYHVNSLSVNIEKVHMSVKMYSIQTLSFQDPCNKPFITPVRRVTLRWTALSPVLTEPEERLLHVRLRSLVPILQQPRHDQPDLQVTELHKITKLVTNSKVTDCVNSCYYISYQYGSDFDVFYRSTFCRVFRVFPCMTDLKGEQVSPHNQVVLYLALIDKIHYCTNIPLNANSVVYKNKMLELVIFSEHMYTT